jgi:hypothetical protein
VMLRPGSNLVAFENVEVVASREVAVVYRIDGRSVTVDPLNIQEGTTAHSHGERGRLVLPEWYAAELGLADGAALK